MPKKPSQAGPTLFDDDRLPTAREMYAEAVAELETVAPLAPPIASDPDPIRPGTVWRYRWPCGTAPERVEILMVFPTNVCFVRVGRSRLEQTTIAIDDFLKRAKPDDDDQRVAG